MSNTITNNTAVGNEDLKAWLKKLDPVSRVRNMSAIAKTQSEAGLRGSLIKASLAQLSQKCQVMLIRLTVDEIKYYTRKKPVKRPRPIDDVEDMYLGVKTPKISKPSIYKNLQNESGDATFKHYNEKFIGTKFTGSKPLTSNLGESSDSFKSRILSINEAKVKKINNKRREKYKELFGDYLDDLPLTTNNSYHLSQDKNMNQSHSTPAEKQVKNVYNTVVVNIYKSPLETGEKNIENNVENTSFNEENHSFRVKNSVNKKLKIGVSMPGCKSKPGMHKLDVLPQQGKVQYHSSTKRKSQKTSSKRKEGPKSKASKPKTKLPSIANINLAEDSRKKLWSILGMESPTDRSESIIRSHPLLSRNNIDAWEDGKLLTQPTEENKAVQLSDPIENGTARNCLEKRLGEVRNHKEPAYEIPIGLHEDIRELSVDESTISVEAEPVCKIANTFSLARYPPVEDDSSLLRSASSLYDNSNKINVQSDVNKNGTNKEISDLQSSNATDTIIIIEDDDARGPVVEHGSNGEQSKVGTIRVKDIGMLMNPELVQHMNSPENLNANSNDANNCNQLNNEDLEIEDDTINRFISTYKYYFDNFVETRIPKLGELLHLAIADLIRKEERIKRAEQLSSNDLINDEKLRAEKDYNEMLKSRGNEFSPSYESIFERFDKKSKQTLFLSLFCRLLKHAEQIDPANKNYVLKGRDVIGCMLSKCQYKDDEVLELLTLSCEEFQRLFELVNNYVIKCANSHMPNTTVSNTTYVEKSSSSEGKHNQTTDKPVSNLLPIRNVVSLATNQEQATLSQTKFPTRISNENSVSFSSANSRNITAMEMPTQIILKPIDKLAKNMSLPSQGQTKISGKVSNKNSASFPTANLSSTRTMDMPNQISNARTTGKTLPVRKGMFATSVQRQNILISTDSPLQTSSKSSESYYITHLPNLTVTTNKSEENMTNRNPSGSVNISRQSSMQNTSSVGLSTATSSLSSSSNVSLQNSTFTGPSHQQTVINTNLSREFCPTRAIHLRVNYSQNAYLTKNPISNSHVAEKDKFGTVYNNINVPIQPNRSSITPAVKSSNSSIIGLSSTPLNVAANNNEVNLQDPQMAAIPSNGDIHHANSTGNSTNTGNVISLSRNESCGVRELLNAQAPLPSSSHCHPFEKRMLISGKMRMMFENSNFTS